MGLPAISGLASSSGKTVSRLQRSPIMIELAFDPTVFRSDAVSDEMLVFVLMSDLDVPVAHASIFFVIEISHCNRKRSARFSLTRANRLDFIGRSDATRLTVVLFQISIGMGTTLNGEGFLLESIRGSANKTLCRRELCDGGGLLLSAALNAEPTLSFRRARIAASVCIAALRLLLNHRLIKFKLKFNTLTLTLPLVC